MTKPIKHELAIFLIVGLLTVTVDFLLYRGILYIKPFGFENINATKGFSFIGGTIFAYFANRFWTFNHQIARTYTVLRFIVVYIVGLLANIFVNDLCITWFRTFFNLAEMSIILAFVLATGVSATLNFIGMKFFVFTDKHFSIS